MYLVEFQHLNNLKVDIKPAKKRKKKEKEKKKKMSLIDVLQPKIAKTWS